ncbi:hypothetical protein RRG08_036142 [Elysia crispata]|uniref:Uncharacterized protein n=1 Tax=Elysia crispata TaxID=231223 RepID=A0AAE0ZJR5_9GAST|nr:hypothetical protein RRG08_036142 [Elysia crispata]
MDRASLGETERASLGETDRASLRETDRASLGETDRASLGETDSASLGETDRASLGETDRASLWETDRASLGETDRASLGETDRASLGETDRASLGETDRASLGETEYDHTQQTLPLGYKLSLVGYSLVGFLVRARSVSLPLYRLNCKYELLPIHLAQTHWHSVEVKYSEHKLRLNSEHSERCRIAKTRAEQFNRRRTAQQTGVDRTLSWFDHDGLNTSVLVDLLLKHAATLVASDDAGHWQFTWPSNYGPFWSTLLTSRNKPFFQRHLVWISLQQTSSFAIEPTGRGI